MEKWGRACLINHSSVFAYSVLRFIFLLRLIERKIIYIDYVYVYYCIIMNSAV